MQKKFHQNRITKIVFAPALMKMFLHTFQIILKIYIYFPEEKFGRLFFICLESSETHFNLIGAKQN